MLSTSRVIDAKLQQQAGGYEERRARGKRNMARGTTGQEVIGWRLRALGLLMVERVHTPWRVQRTPAKNGQPSRITGATQMEKVSGDWRAVMPGGKSVLVEVKAVDHLTFSEFADHQVKALNDHLAAGGLSLIGWVFTGGDAVLVWPVPGFVPRTSLAIETAKRLNITRIRSEVSRG